MAKKRKKPDGPFKTEGMTIEEIRKLDYQIVNSMNKRDLSHALKTMALAANKRVKRLKDYNELDIAPDALNYLSDMGYSRKKFGSKNKTLNEMRAEFKVVSEFLGMKTSTIKGATSVRKMRENRIMGMSREQAVKKGRSEFISRYMEEHAGRAPKMAAIKKEMKRLMAQYEQMNSDAWQIYRDLLEAEGWPNSPYTNYHGSDEIIAMIGKMVQDEYTHETILQSAIDAFDKNYEQMQEDINKEDEDGEDEGFTVPY